MKKFKAVLWTLVILFLLLVFFQNKAFFSAKAALTLNLFVTDAYRTPELPTGVWFLGGMILGFFLAYFFGLVERFRSYRIIKGLKARLDSRAEAVPPSGPSPEPVVTSLSSEKETPEL
jgi:hypothetical protein